MNGLEIFSLVTSKRKKIEELTDFTTFVLNPEVVKLEKEIDELQSRCKHEFEKGACKYCGKEDK